MNPAKNSALKFLSFRNSSIKEVQNYLTRKRFPPEEIITAIDDLIELNFLDDEKFAKEWVEIRLKSRPCGPIKLKFELCQKGIDKEIIQKVTKLDYPEIIKDAAVRYSRKLTNLDPQKKRQRLAAFLARRGFTWNQISVFLN